MASTRPGAAPAEPCVRVQCEVPRQLGEARRHQRLLGVGERAGGIVVHFDHQPSAPADTRRAPGLDQIARRRVRWIRDDRQVVSGRARAFRHVQRVAVDVSKVRMPRSQRITRISPAAMMYSAAPSHSSTVEPPALEQDGLPRGRPRAAGRSSACCARDLQDIGLLRDRFT